MEDAAIFDVYIRVLISQNFSNHNVIYVSVDMQTFRKLLMFKQPLSLCHIRSVDWLKNITNTCGLHYFICWCVWYYIIFVSNERSWTSKNIWILFNFVFFKRKICKYHFVVSEAQIYENKTYILDSIFEFKNFNVCACAVLTKRKKQFSLQYHVINS